MTDPGGDLPSVVSMEILRHGRPWWSAERFGLEIAIGAWLTRGSRHESDQESGIAHFTEHMLFKGTDRRSARDLAQAIDSVGGQVDAFTSKEYVGYYIKVLDEHVPVALDLLSDMLLNPALNAEDIVREQGVVLEEIKMVEDAPDAVAVEVGQEVGDHEGEVVEGEVGGAAQGADHRALLLGGLPGQPVRPGGAVEASFWPALAPLADGRGADAVTLGQNAGAFGRAGDLGAHGGGGTGVGMDRQHRVGLHRSQAQAREGSRGGRPRQPWPWRATAWRRPWG